MKLRLQRTQAGKSIKPHHVGFGEDSNSNTLSIDNRSTTDMSKTGRENASPESRLVVNQRPFQADTRHERTAPRK